MIVLDNSYSMTRIRDGKTLYELAQQRAKEVTDAMSPGDEAYLLTCDTSAQQSKRAFHDFAAMQQQIERTGPDYRLTNLTACLQSARKRLRQSHNVNKEIYLISDLQAVAFGQDSLTSLDLSVRTLALPISALKTSNLSAEQIKFASTILEKGRIAELQAVIANRGTQPARNKLAQLFLNDTRVAQSVLNLEAGASMTVSFKFLLEKSGFNRGYVLLEDDDITADNRRYFSFSVPDQVKIAVTGFQPSDTEYLELALGVTKTQESNYQIDKIPFEKLRFIDLESFDVLVFSNTPSFDTPVAEKLRTYAQAGGGVLLALGRNVDLRSYNETICRALALPKFLEVIGTAGENSPIFSLGKIDLMHPIFAGIFEPDQGHFAEPQFHFAVKTQENQNVDKIMEYIDGSPFLFEKREGQGTVLVFTSGFDLQLTDLPHRTIFAPLISRCISYLATRTNNIPDYLVGQELRFKLPAEAVNTALEMTRPDERSDRLQPDVTGNGAWIYYQNTDLPGIYKLFSEDQLIAQWAVNVDARESDLAVLKDSEMESKYRMSVPSPHDDLRSTIYIQRFGRELWKYFAMTALLFLIIEMLIYREKGEVAAGGAPVRSK